MIDWDNAPEGATHYVPPYGLEVAAWVKPSASVSASFDCMLLGSDKWVIDPSLNTEEHRLIPRPTKPAAPEWDGYGWPDVGVECEVKIEEWEKCRVIGFDKPFMCVSREGAGYYAAMQEELRPIRTKEQRERDELVKTISQHPIYKNAVDDLAEAIIAAGYRKQENN